MTPPIDPDLDSLLSAHDADDADLRTGAARLAADLRAALDIPGAPEGPDAATLAAYLDGVLDGRERTAVVALLAGSSAARADLLAAAVLLDTVASRAQAAPPGLLDKARGLLAPEAPPTPQALASWAMAARWWSRLAPSRRGWELLLGGAAALCLTVVLAPVMLPDKAAFPGPVVAPPSAPGRTAPTVAADRPPVHDRVALQQAPARPPPPVAMPSVAMPPVAMPLPAKAEATAWVGAPKPIAAEPGPAPYRALDTQQAAASGADSYNACRDQPAVAATAADVDSDGVAAAITAERNRQERCADRDASFAAQQDSASPVRAKSPPPPLPASPIAPQ